MANMIEQKPNLVGPVEVLSQPVDSESLDVDEPVTDDGDVHRAVHFTPVNPLSDEDNY
jgi:hypothetical protein